MSTKRTAFLLCRGLLLSSTLSLFAAKPINGSLREHLSINDGWKFYRYSGSEQPDHLIYDVRPEVTDAKDDKPADAMPTDPGFISSGKGVLNEWILPSGNEFISDAGKRYVRPAGNPGENFPFVRSDFKDDGWESINLPHDWAIKGPFYVGENVPVGGGMGRLPVQGVAWYRRKLEIPATDAGKSIFLDVDGAMSYAMVWLNGKLVGGWPYGYTSWRLDLTPYIKLGGVNQLAIRVDNPTNSARWYPGAGIYRNIWLSKTGTIRVKHWGSKVHFNTVSKENATVVLDLFLENAERKSNVVSVCTDYFEIDSNDCATGLSVASTISEKIRIKGNSTDTVTTSVSIRNPKLWGPYPTQTPNRYLAVTTITSGGETIDRYETIFGIRSIGFDPDKGIFVNGEKIVIKGVNQHHDLGALDKHPYVAGGFVWTGWDYIGEPTPYYSSRSSYSGVIDLAGFKKDRFYLYQSYWRPDFPMAHLLPHWTWPDRIGQVTPVHVMTSGDEAELFLNGKSLGRKQKAPYEYRLRWDSVYFEPGQIKVITYKKGQVWALVSVSTAGTPQKLELTADRTVLKADGSDLSFITLRVADKDGVTIPAAKNTINFRLEGSGEIVATDNGDPSDMTAFPSTVRKAFNGYCLLIVRTKKGEAGKMRILALSEGLTGCELNLKSIK